MLLRPTRLAWTTQFGLSLRLTAHNTECAHFAAATLKALCPVYLDGKGGNDAPGPDQVVLAQVVEGLIQDDGSSLEPHRLLELDALELLQVLHTGYSRCETTAYTRLHCCHSC